MAGSTTLENLFIDELKQRQEEGCNVEGFLERFEVSGKDKDSIDRLYDELMSLKIEKDFPYCEPSDLNEIRAQRPDEAVVLSKAKTIEMDHFYGAWLGRCCGCALGKPLECTPFIDGKDGIPGWKYIYEWFKSADAYPIKGYVPFNSKAADKYGFESVYYKRKSFKENIAYMETDDDIRYTVLGLMMLEEKGLNWDSWDIGEQWLARLPYNLVATAEKQAYMNLPFAYDMINGSKPIDKKEALEWVRTYRNPYREWIGAQIRVDGYAYGVAGNPELAAELAWRDASLSHVKNGIYGAMFCAAMIAAAFVETDNKKIVNVGLTQIPKNCRLAMDIKKAIEIAESAKDELDLVERLWDTYSHYHCVHTNNNAALCAASIIFAGNDFEKAIAIAVLGGWDTDCNGATVGSIVGAKLGAKKIPDSWKNPLNDTLYSYIPEFHPIAISECANRSYKVWGKLTQNLQI